MSAHYAVRRRRASPARVDPRPRPRRRRPINGAAAPRPAHRDRRVVPAPGGAERRTCTSARVAHLRGPAAAVRRAPRLAPRRGCTSCRATARSCRSRPPGPAGRCGSTTRLQPRVPRPPHRAARARAPRSSSLQLAARIFSQQLDRAKPLWEMWLVEGLADGRFALISKTHHALIDGIAGVDLAHGAVRPRARARRRRRTPTSRGSPRREPSSAELLARRDARAAARGRARPRRTRRASLRAPGARARRRARGGRGPRRDRLGRPEPGAGDAAERRDRPAPPLRGRAQRARRLQGRQERVRRDGQRRRADRRQRRAARLAADRAACAPRASSCARSCRSRSAPQDERGALGNRIAAMRGPLPVYVEDPVARLRVVREAMDGLKESKQAVGAEVLSGVQNFAPPTILAQASRLNFSTRLFNLHRHERPRAAVPALRARPRARGGLPGRVPARRTTRWRSRSCPTTAR